MECPICGGYMEEQYILNGDMVTGYEYECIEGDGSWTMQKLRLMEDGQ